MGGCARSAAGCVERDDRLGRERMSWRPRTVRARAVGECAEPRRSFGQREDAHGDNLGECVVSE